MMCGFPARPLPVFKGALRVPLQLPDDLPSDRVKRAFSKANKSYYAYDALCVGVEDSLTFKMRSYV